MKIKSNISLILFSYLCLSLMACSNSKADFSEFDKEIYKPLYASGFRILGAGDKESVLIESSNPWQGADSIVRRLLILRGNESCPEGFDGEVMEGYASRIVAMSSTHIAMLDAIGEVGKIVGVSGRGFVSNPTVLSNPGRFGDVGFDGNIDYELLVSLSPDLILLYGTNGQSGMEGKLRELGIPFIYVGDYLEESPLGKAEWMVVLGEITGERVKAEEKIISIADNYQSLAGTVAKAIEAGTLQRPKVMVNAPFGDSWFLPSAKSYIARLITDAGGEYLGTANTSNSSQNIDREQAFILCNQADVWLNVGSFDSLSQLTKSLPQWADIKVVSNGRVFNNTARSNNGGGNDFYESGTVNPDLVLGDLVEILQPSLSKSGDLVYYKQLK